MLICSGGLPHEVNGLQSEIRELKKSVAKQTRQIKLLLKKLDKQQPAPGAAKDK